MRLVTVITYELSAIRMSGLTSAPHWQTVEVVADSDDAARLVQPDLDLPLLVLNHHDLDDLCAAIQHRVSSLSNL